MTQMRRAVQNLSAPSVALLSVALNGGSYQSASVAGSCATLCDRRVRSRRLTIYNKEKPDRRSRNARVLRSQVLSSNARAVRCQSQCFSQPSTAFEGHNLPQRNWSFVSYTWVLYLGFLLSVLAYYVWVSYLTLSWPFHWVLIKLRAVRNMPCCTLTDEAAVQLYVYDLSNGLAQQLSPVLLNKQVDGIWHTAIVVGGLEYYYGAGISQSGPGLTPFGKPLRVIELGCTCIPRGQQEAFLRELQMEYTTEAYSLFHHNCNHFTNDFAIFLTGSGIPGHILALPEELLATPFGQMLAPMLSPLEKRLGTIRQQPAGIQAAVPFQEQQLTAALTPDNAQMLKLATAPAIALAAGDQIMSAVQLTDPGAVVTKPAQLPVPAFVKDARLGEATLNSGTVNNGPVVKLAAKDIVKATGLTAWLRLYAARRLLRRKRRERRLRQSREQLSERASSF